MATKLQCEICGGKLIGKPGGVFECDSCGVEYNTEWAKQKIQEIRGTVTVEGTVDVQGTVKVDSSANKEALLQRGMMALEEEKWNEAKDFFDQALNYDAEYAEAYVGLAMVEGKCKDNKIYAQVYCDPYSDFYESVNIQRAKKYANNKLLQEFKDLDEKRAEVIAPVRLRDKRLIDSILDFYNQPARKMLQVHSSGDIYGLRTDGTILLCCDDQFSKYGDEKQKKMREASKWNDIVSFSIGNNHILGLKNDGTVLAAGWNYYGECDVSSWKNIAIVKAYDIYSYGIKTDGTLVVAGGRNEGECDVQSWRDIVDVFVLSNASSTFSTVTIGLKRNGTIITCGDIRDNDRERFKELNKWKDISFMVQHSFANEDLFLGYKKDGSYVKWSTKGILENYIKPGNILIEKIEDYSEWIGLWADRTVKEKNTLLMENVIDICGTKQCMLGLHSDGKVTCYGERIGEYLQETAQWSDVIKLLFGGFFRRFRMYGLRRNGTIVTTNEDKRAELSKWKLFDNYENVESEQKTKIVQERERRIAAKEKEERERKEAIERAEIEKRNQIKRLTEEQNELRVELSKLTGMFSGKRRKEIQSRLTEVETTLAAMKSE